MGAFNVEEKCGRKFPGHDEDDQDSGGDEGENKSGKDEAGQAVGELGLRGGADRVSYSFLIVPVEDLIDGGGNGIKTVGGNSGLLDGPADVDFEQFLLCTVDQRADDRQGDEGGVVGDEPEADFLAPKSSSPLPDMVMSLLLRLIFSK